MAYFLPPLTMAGNKNKKEPDQAATTESGQTDRAQAPAKALPLHRILEGDINIAVWPNEVKTRDGTRTFYSYTIERSYQDKLGNYKYTRSMNSRSRDNLLKAIDRVSEYLFSLENPDSMLPGEERAGRAEA
jgi:hypothetical protein